MERRGNKYKRDIIVMSRFGKTDETDILCFIHPERKKLEERNEGA